jgi:hypothetical protein
MERALEISQILARLLSPMQFISETFGAMGLEEHHATPLFELKSMLGSRILGGATRIRWPEAEPEGGNGGGFSGGAGGCEVIIEVRI